MNYYNDNDPKACAWLRELIAQGCLPPGDVDNRSILEVKPDDLRPYTQCHFFAGVGGWPLALAWASWPADRPVWTGSCPCQPFSAAGQRKAEADERHLWPAFARLIRECRPGVVFGEQVASAIGFGWLDGVCTDLEAEGYAVGAHVLGAHSVGAPHRRQRLYWVADAGYDGQGGGSGPASQDSPIGMLQAVQPARCRGAGGMAYADVGRYEALRILGTQQAGQTGLCGATHALANVPSERCDGSARAEPGRRGEAAGSGRLGNAASRGCGIGRDAAQPGRGGHADRAGWARYDILPCRDGKARRIESGTCPLAHGVPGRVGLLRGYGNAIVPQCAAEFIAAFMEVTE